MWIAKFCRSRERMLPGYLLSAIHNCELQLLLVPDTAIARGGWQRGKTFLTPE